MDFFKSKVFVSLLVFLVYFLEFRRGTFRGTGKRLREISTGFYFRLFLVFFLVSAVLFFADSYLLGFVHGMDKPVLDFVSGWGGQLGRRVNLWVFMIGLYFLGLALTKCSWFTVSFGMMISSSAAGVLCYFSKMLFLRARPNANEGPFSFFNFESLSNDGGTYHSFPSGDVVVVAGAAYYLFLRVKNKFLKLILLLLPLATALSRVNENKHWPSDTVLALGFGLISAFFVRDLFVKRLTA
ncbi:MAG: phosphatase PAP2 family protein [Candidatus Omnitrophica bacterium]|nr:phosphatase PAP2 family protein [Candidatus Omnitrophota bacterium]